MVPSRSRKTAGRRDLASARSHLRGTKPAARCRLDSFWLDARHATVIDRTAPQKTRAAVGLFLHHAAVESDWRGAVRICRAKNCNHRQAHCRGDMHCPRIVADEKLATREQRRQIGNRRFADKLNYRAAYSRRNNVGYFLLRSRTEKNHIRIRVAAVTIYKIREAFWRPTLRGTVGRARSNGDAGNVAASAGGKQYFFSALPLPFSNFELHMMFVRQRVDPADAPEEFEIIKLFMRRHFSALWDRNSLGEQEAPAITCIPDALRYSRTP